MPAPPQGISLQVVGQQQVQRIAIPRNIYRFIFSAPDTHATKRLNTYYNNDGTAVSTTNTTRTNLKSYSYSLGYAHGIRVRVYAHVSGGTGTIYLNIDGTDVASNTGVSATGATLYIDYIDSLASGSHTIRVDAVAPSGQTIYIDRVVIITGLLINSTTATTVYSFSPSYSLTNELPAGSIDPSEPRIGIKIRIFLNRKTTAAATITINTTSVSVAAADDGDNIANIFTTANYNASSTISAAVGASGNAILITEIYYQVTLVSWNDGVAFGIIHNKNTQLCFVGSALVTLLYPDGGEFYDYLGVVTNMIGGNRNNSINYPSWNTLYMFSFAYVCNPYSFHYSWGEAGASKLGVIISMKLVAMDFSTTTSVDISQLPRRMFVAKPLDAMGGASVWFARKPSTKTWIVTRIESIYTGTGTGAATMRLLYCSLEPWYNIGRSGFPDRILSDSFYAVIPQSGTGNRDVSVSYPLLILPSGIELDLWLYSSANETTAIVEVVEL